jgi:hypothetical protein
LSRSTGARATVRNNWVTEPIAASAPAPTIRIGVRFRRSGDNGSRCRGVRSATVAAIATIAIKAAVAALAAISAGRRGLIQRRCDRLPTACIGGNRLAVAAWHAIIVWIDSIRAG